MLAQSSTAFESTASSLPQVRLATQPDAWSTQLPNVRSAAITDNEEDTSLVRGAQQEVDDLLKSEQLGTGYSLLVEGLDARKDTRHEDISALQTAAGRNSNMAPPPCGQGPSTSIPSFGKKPPLHRRSKVPKDQINILQCSSSHFPPLPGHDLRPGALPVKLLEAFSAQADDAARNENVEVAHSPQKHDETQPHPDSDQQVSASQWPASPDRGSMLPDASLREYHSSRPPSLSPVIAAQRLSHAPPDSSPLPLPNLAAITPDVDQAIRDTASTATSSIGEEVYVSARKGALSQTSSSQDSDLHAEIEGDQTGLTESSANNRSSTTCGVCRESKVCANRRFKCIVTNCSKARCSHNQYDRKDPANVVELVSPRWSPVSDVPAKPGGEEMQVKRSGPASCTELASPPAKRQQNAVPGHPESSGDAAVQVKQTPHPGLRGSSTMAIAREGPTSTCIPSTYREMTSPALGCETTTIHVQPTDGPITKDGQCKPEQQKEVVSVLRKEYVASPSPPPNPHLAKIVQDARNYRRNMLKPISKRVTSSTHTPSPHDHSAQTHPYQQRPPCSDPTNSKTPIVPAITKLNLVSHSALEMAAPSDRTALMTSNSTITHSSSQKAMAGTGLFQRFRQTYPDFQGTSKQFDGACRLLARVNSSRRLHSFLLDDFVFHYVQSYLSYFSGCHESGEDPLTYLDYFDSVTPSHLEKVISASDLSGVDCGDSHRLSTTPAPVRQPAMQPTEVSNRSQVTVDELVPVETVRKDHTTCHAKQADLEAPVSSAIKQHFSLSQQSSVEEWLQQTAATRAESPELGTRDINRPHNAPASRTPQDTEPMSLKRPLTSAAMLSSGAKRQRVATAQQSSTKHDAFVKPRRSLPRQSSAVDNPRYQQLVSAASTSATNPAPRRSLPASFSSIKVKGRNTTLACTPATATTTATPQSTLRPTIATQTPRPPSKPAPPSSERPSSSTPKSAMPAANAASTSKVGVVKRKRSILQDENTPFKRFAASWERLPSERSARHERDRTRHTGVNPYALVDVTQWRQ